jgi:type II secretory pathway component GspD/PulD (secretin)
MRPAHQDRRFTVVARLPRFAALLAASAVASIAAAVASPAAAQAPAPAQPPVPGAPAPAPAAKPAAGPVTASGARQQQPAPAAEPTSPEPTADPGQADPVAEPRGAVWGVPGPSAANGGVSTPIAGPGAAGTPPTAGPTAAGANAAQPAPAGAPRPDAKVILTQEGRFTLSAQAIDIAKLLELISIKARQNIVASDKVKGYVTVNLFDVPLEDALDAILNVNGLAWRRQGDFIYVFTRAEVDAQRTREQRIFTLQFLSADDAIAFVKPVLTDGGSAVALGKVEQGYLPTVENGGADGYAFAAKVMVSDYPDVIERVAKMVAELDTPPKQVRVEATILTADLTDDTAFGLDISVVGNINFNDVTSPLAAFDDVFSGAVKPDTPATANAASLYPTSSGQPSPTGQIGVVTNDVAVFLRMLDQVVDTNVLARPSVTALNRQRAQVLVGERIAYLSTTQTQTSTTQEVKYLDVGVKLIFRPFVSPDGMVRLELAPQVSTARIKNIDAAGGSKATVPDEISQELRTNVRVKSGQTIVLGGLFREQSVTTNRQIPGLGDLLPGAFSGASSAVIKQEIIFLITPTVIEDAQDYQQGEKALQVAEAARVGSRAGLLPFSQTHLAGAYQVQAMEAWKAGDRSAALYYVDHALRLQPASPSMIELREAIRTDRKDLHSTEFDAMTLLSPAVAGQRGWVAPPTDADRARDIPPMVDNDFRPHDPLPLPDLEAPSMPGERNFRRDVPAPAPAPAQPDPATKEPKP